jgi:hypothetical protein
MFKNDRTWWAGTLALIGACAVLTPAAVLGGMLPQSVLPQGMLPQGMLPQGMLPQGMLPQGMLPQGMLPQGMLPQGMLPQGMLPQGMLPQGVPLMGGDLVGAETKGVSMVSVTIRGTTATDTSEPTIELTSVPGLSTGTGNYITVGGASAVGHYAVATMGDINGAPLTPAETVDLYIAGVMRDPIPNAFHDPAEQDNEAALYVVYTFQKVAGQWVSLCPYDDRTRAASAMAIAEDPSQPSKFIFACTATGVAAKCARSWGYRPWASTKTWKFDKTINGWVEETVALRPYYEACKLAARAAYCQDEKSFTKNGTLVDLFDTSQIVWPNAIENPFSSLVDSSRWMMAQEYFVSTLPRIEALASSPRKSALQRTRYRELSPQGQCGEFSFIDRLEHSHIEDGRWATALANKEIHVFSPLACKHNEQEVGAALPWDCSPCTTQVCRQQPTCCGKDGGTWDETCVTRALDTSACRDAAGNPVVGKVWPRDIPRGTSTGRSKFLLGAGGAVLRVDGAGPAATISGWACDPEWPMSSVRVRVYGGAPREMPGTVLLDEVRADKELAAPLAGEVAAACDGAYPVAYHGFTLSLASWQGGGNLFVYAIDEATSDGPAAPPTLLRNGIVDVPESATTPGPVGSAYTAVATGWIEVAQDNTYRFVSSVQPSRLWINGEKVLGWGPWLNAPDEGNTTTTQGAISLNAGVRYHIRWDRLQTEPPPEGTELITWQRTSVSGQGLSPAAIPTDRLYQLAPGTGIGLRATYSNSFGGGQASPDCQPGLSVQRIDPFIDVSPDAAPPSEPRQTVPAGICPNFNATWEGEIVPPATDDYVFHVVLSGLMGTAGFPSPPPSLTVGSTLPLDTNIALVTQPAPGCHSECQVGHALDRSCSSCVQQVCALDPFCCDGGYSSYYSIEPVWDAKCVSEARAQCGSALACAPPAPAGPTDWRFARVRLQAGVHYRFFLSAQVPSADPAEPLGGPVTMQLLWESAGMLKQRVPQFALYPAGQPVPATGTGSGLNVAYFGTKVDQASGGVVVPDFDVSLAAGATPGISASPTVGPLGTPLVELFPAPSDPSTERLPPPRVTSPTFGAEFAAATAPENTTVLTVQGTGVAGHIVTVSLNPDFLNLSDAERTALLSTLPHRIADVASDGTFSTTVPVPNSFGGIPLYGTWALKLMQKNGPNVAGTRPPSPTVRWPFVLATSTLLPGTIQIDSPRDLTYSPIPTENKFTVSGLGVPGLPVTVTDLNASSGGVPVLTPTGMTAGPDGTIKGMIELPVGWHKLVFNQPGAQSNIVFVAVGIQPPTIQFPRSDAELGTTPDCAGDGKGWRGDIVGTTLYSPDQLGRVYVAEETGTGALKRSFTPASVVPTLGSDGLYHFAFSFVDPYDASAPGAGKHVLYVFQAPDPPATASAAEVEAHFRGFAGVAAATKLVVNVPPARFPIPGGAEALDCPDGCTTGLLPDVEFSDAAADNTRTVSRLGCDSSGPTGPTTSTCARPFADVNMRVGSLVYSGRADENGNWSIPRVKSFGPGWTTLTIAEVVDSTVGGAWSESCLSKPVSLSREQGDDIFGIVTAGGISVEATSAAGAAVTYTVSTAGIGTAHSSLPVPTCSPASGSTFPIGTTPVLCSASTATTTRVASFNVTVFDGDPTIVFPPVLAPGADGVARIEATDSTGAMVTYQVTATDAIDGALNASCVPSSPQLFFLGIATGVTCTATDSAGNTETDSTVVLVVDTMPPALTLPAPITVDAGPAGTASVSFGASALDLVSGTVPVVCSPASGSPFAVGTTTVDCSAADALDNVGHGSFTVTVRPQQNTPPVVTVPGNLTVEATGASGAIVAFAASAADTQDGPLTPTCAPASGTLFALGTKTVTCTATDSGGLTGSASFTVTVADKKGPVWSNVPGTIVAYATSTAGAKVSYTKPTATDAIDGARPVTCTPASGAQFPVNKTTVTCTASDSKGNSTTAKFTVWVQYQAPADGSFFLFPIRADGSSIFRVGRPVPARFRLTGASKDITNLVATFQATKISSAIQGTTEVTSDETVDDTDFVFKYRPLLKFYAYRWKTRDQTQGTYRLTATLGDGVVHQVNVSLKSAR